ncbi:MarR family winged helix-turn-helix transcriptional regulator [Sphingosinicella sp. CPCC 101087]|uniref:MarR family winged helix-turn-helix transcriptional regulator n=1 Tax=Sphingosinicella sp. CPCC 101087 TaxID=2497754 RepID=UPI0013E9D840|nr:MarR family transcriptional regulator [Sphingosinicella sp. CPCC 101087]
MSDEAIMSRFLARPGFLLARIDQICTAIYGSLDGGETLAQAELLMLLGVLGPSPQIKLARCAGVDKSTTAYIIENLNARGWVERGPCREDRRRALVSLTPTGQSQIARIERQFADLQRQLARPLDADALPRAVTLLHKLGSNPMSPAPLWVPACHPAVGILDTSLSFLCRRALQLFQAQFVACTPGLNLTLRQFSLLYIVSAREAITQAAFARLFGLDPSTCAVIIRGLVSRGLIAGTRSAQDKRERIYAITDQGRSILLKAQPLVDRSERLIFRGEPAARTRWLVRQLQAIVRDHSHRLRFPGVMAAP